MLLRRAKNSFAAVNTSEGAFVEKESATHLSMRGQGGEEIVVGAMARSGATLVTASSYMFDAQVSRFFSTLPPAAESASEVVA